MPFRVPLDAPVRQLAAGEKQKLEILKQLYLEAALPDPRRADLGADAAGGRRGAGPCARARAARASCTVLMITHKFREVTAYRRRRDRAAPRQAGAARGRVGRPDAGTTWRAMMIGDAQPSRARAGRSAHACTPRARRSCCERGRPARAGRPRHAGRRHRAEPDGARGRDRRHRRRLRQRPAGTGRGPGRPARRAGRQRPRQRASPTPPRATRTARAATCAACPRSRCATPACRA